MWPLVAIVAIVYGYSAVYETKKAATVRRLTDRGFGYVDRAWNAADRAAARRSDSTRVAPEDAEAIYDDAELDAELDDAAELPPGFREVGSQRGLT